MQTIMGLQLPRSAAMSYLTLDRNTEEVHTLRQTVKFLVRASRHLHNLNTLTLDVCKCVFSESSPPERYLVQHWISVLLIGATKLTSLSMVTDHVPWTPVMGLLPIRHLELTIEKMPPWMDAIMADLSLCSCLETLKITEDMESKMSSVSKSLPDLLLHDVATLKSVELLGWYPKEDFTLPPWCMLRLAVALSTRKWNAWQTRGCATSMLYLECMKLRAWPADLQDMSGLRYLDLYCTQMQNQNLAALQHIPHVSLAFKNYSTFLLTHDPGKKASRSGEKLGCNVSFSNADAFVRGTQRFLFECTSQEAEGMYKVLRAACMRQGVACHECEHTEGYPEGITFACLSNVKVCGASNESADKGVAYPDQLRTWIEHECFIPTYDFWPARDEYPELYS